MSPEVSRFCAKVKNAEQMLPGSDVSDRLVAAAERAERIEDLPSWVRVLAKHHDITPESVR